MQDDLHFNTSFSEVKRTVSDAAVEEPPSSSSTSDMAVNEPLTEDHSEDLVDTSNKQMDPKLNMPEKVKSPPKKDILLKQPNSTTETPSNSLVTAVKEEEEEEMKSNEGIHAEKEKEIAPNEERNLNKEDEIATSEESCAKIMPDLLCCCFISLELDAKDYRVLNEKAPQDQNANRSFCNFSESFATHLCMVSFPEIDF